MKLATLAGVGLVAAHAAAFLALAARTDGSELAVTLDAPLAAPVAAIAGTVPADLAGRVTVTEDPPGPGLHRKRWKVRYRGGFTREVGATQLVGPFQDPATPACTGRVVVGQRLLDDGRAGPGTIAGAMAKLIDAELKDESIFPVGDYQRLEHVAVTWARLERRPEDVTLVGFPGAPEGYVRVSATIVFKRVEVPLVVALVPQHAPGAIQFRIAARAELAFGNPFFQWVSNKLGGDRLATRLARRQIDDVLTTTFAPPPPFALSDGQQLQFTYCQGAIEITDGAYGALPFAVAIGKLGNVLPPRFGAVVYATPPADTTLALDLGIDALNAMLFELWRTGWLDRRLDEVGLDRRFDTDPIVTEYLSIRISPLRLALPPVIAPGPRDGTLRLGADARVAIARWDSLPASSAAEGRRGAIARRDSLPASSAAEGRRGAIDDGAVTTIGRLWGTLDLHFAPKTAGSKLPIAVDLGGLELACERTATTLVPCYGDLVAALADRGAEFHGALTDAFAHLIEDVFVNRTLSAGGLGAELALRGVTPTIAGASIHLDLDAAVR